MDAGVAPADVRPGWLSHRDVSHSWLAGARTGCLYYAAQRSGCCQVCGALSHQLLSFNCCMLGRSHHESEFAAKVLPCSGAPGTKRVQVWCSSCSSSAQHLSSMWCVAHAYLRGAFQASVQSRLTLSAC